MTKTPNILVVDDDQDFLVQMKMILESAGYAVETRNNINAAQDYLKKTRPDICIIDLMMENQDDGFVLCHHIKKIDNSIPVIMVTAVTQETGIEFDAATREERSWIKADLLLDKPVRPEQLKTSIEQLLKG